MNLQEIETGIAQIETIKAALLEKLREHVTAHGNESERHESEALAGMALIAKIEGKASPPAEDQAAAGVSFALTKRKQVTFNWRWLVLGASLLMIVYAATHHLL